MFRIFAPKPRLKEGQPLDQLHRSYDKDAELNEPYVVLSIGAGLIATFGLLSDNTAVVLDARGELVGDEFHELVELGAVPTHARVQRVAGLDYINRALGASNYKANHTILVTSHNPADEWRSLKFLNDWTLDGIVMSDGSSNFAGAFWCCKTTSASVWKVVGHRGANPPPDPP